MHSFPSTNSGGQTGEKKRGYVGKNYDPEYHKKRQMMQGSSMQSAPVTQTSIIGPNPNPNFKGKPENYDPNYATKKYIKSETSSQAQDEGQTIGKQAQGPVFESMNPNYKGKPENYNPNFSKKGQSLDAEKTIQGITPSQGPSQSFASASANNNGGIWALNSSNTNKPGSSLLNYFQSTHSMGGNLPESYSLTSDKGNVFGQSGNSQANNRILFPGLQNNNGNFIFQSASVQVNNSFSHQGPSLLANSNMGQFIQSQLAMNQASTGFFPNDHLSNNKQTFNSTTKLEKGMEILNDFKRKYESSSKNSLIIDEVMKEIFSDDY